MKEEVSPRRYYLEMQGEPLASICILRHEKSYAAQPDTPDFTVVIGLREGVGEAAAKALLLEDLLKPARSQRHGAILDKGEAMITLSYTCTSPHNQLCPPEARTPPATFILGVLCASGHLPNVYYQAAMRHYRNMENALWGFTPGTPLKAEAAIWN
ncbi:MAG TPA: hypothetical protein VHB73_07230 [Alphaproteobacteria bacterium]|nr:hypothetical protein [Alphaproteobacteria bacterium]